MTDNPTMYNYSDIISNTDSSPPVGLYVGVSVAALFLLISLTTIIIVVIVVKNKEGEYFLYLFLFRLSNLLFVINLQVLKIKHKG